MLPTAPPVVALHRAALFLDFDGTLVDIADRPDRIEVAGCTIALLAELQDRLDGALAIVSGRDIPDLDRYLSPLKLCTAGVHGLVRRDAAGRRHDAVLDSDAFARLRAAMARGIEPHDGLLLEEKTGSLALHYRARPELQQECRAAVAAAIEASGKPDVTVMQGKMVIETRFDHRTKGTAIAAFLDEAPFRDRMPVFAGDDVTDEDGFVVVAHSGGIGVKIGDGPSAASYRLDTPASLRAWLRGLVAPGADNNEGALA